MTAEDCRRLTRLRPRDDVAYQPGIDVRGRAVAPADLEDDGASNRIRPPERIVIPIEVDLLDRYGIPANPDLFDADAQVGEVVYRDGKLFYNGQRLADNASDRIAVLCAEQLGHGSARR